MEALGAVEQFERHLEERSLAPLRRTSAGYYALIGFLVLVVAWGALVYAYQLREGLVVTSMRDRISWGLYIAMYVFFIGVSMAGTFVSAILRITKAGWRSPITRAAEMVTVAALMIAALFILFNSRQNPEQTLFKMFYYGRWASPVTWDVFGLSTYLIGSLIYLYAALVPDLAYCRDRVGEQEPALKRWFFQTFSIGWRDTPAQRSYLQIGLTIMMILIIPVAVSMHTVTSWLFSMTLREPWDSPMFGIYFVGGAIFSGLGIIIILMAVLRKAYGLEAFVTRKHFIYLGYMMSALAAIMIYFNVSEFVTYGYKLSGSIPHHLEDTFIGEMAPLFWFYLGGGVMLPMVMVALPFTRNITGMVVAAVLVNIGMFIERYLIVVGGLRLPLNPYDPPSYSPTWVEWSLVAGGVALFVLIIAVLLKLVPAVAVTEMIEESRQKVQEEAPAFEFPPIPTEEARRPFTFGGAFRGRYGGPR